jgi:hypothetical protein
MAMIDLGCTHTCIGEKVVKEKNIPTQKLATSMTARNADGTMTGNKQITDFVKVERGSGSSHNAFGLSRNITWS